MDSSPNDNFTAPDSTSKYGTSRCCVFFHNDRAVYSKGLVKAHRGRMNTATQLKRKTISYNWYYYLISSMIIVSLAQEFFMSVGLFSFSVTNGYHDLWWLYVAHTITGANVLSLKIPHESCQ